MFDRKLRIGTRGSKMAIIQAKLVDSQLKHHYPDLETEIVVIETSGDWKPEHGEKPLSEAAGGKGLFAKEIELALLEDKIDIGVHAVKDMPSFLPEGLSMLHYLKRDDVRDALVCEKHTSFDTLPQGATIGSTSVRRRAFLLKMRPDLNVIDIRGNVTTRMDKMAQGQVDALILSLSGLERIHETSLVQHKFTEEEMLPACGQGGIGIEFRELDIDIRTLLDAIHDHETGLTISSERGALRALGGSCRTPIGAYATLDDNNTLSLTVSVIRKDGSQVWTKNSQAIISDVIDADQLGFDLGVALKNEIDLDVLL